MSLNPVQFGKDVTDQFGRYLLSAFPIANEDLDRQAREQIMRKAGNDRHICKGPYVYLNQPYKQGASFDELKSDATLDLHPKISDFFDFDQLHMHQENAVRSVCDDRNVVLTTSTGSGKTEAFLLPIINHCLKLRDAEEPPGVAAVIVYPMNALVNDQLRRLRRMLAGSRITFGRYTGDTPREHPDTLQQLSSSRPYTPEELARAARSGERLPAAWEERTSREEISSEKTCPRILLTNYRMLEYMLLRNRDVGIFRGAPLKYFVLDEVHTYTGVLGSEVACLVRRLREICGNSDEDVRFVGTSATVMDPLGEGSGQDIARDFAGRLFGVEPETIDVVSEETVHTQPPPDKVYTPPAAEHPRKLLEEILQYSRDIQLADDPMGVPDDLLQVSEQLCGRKAPEGPDNDHRLYRLLHANRMVQRLGEMFDEPHLLEEAIRKLRHIGERGECSDDDLIAEMLSYLTLGVVACEDEEPLLHPKLHYFIEGLQGLCLVFTPDGPRLYIDQARAEENTDRKIFPMMVCRSCGQHYIELITSDEEAPLFDDTTAAGVRPVRIPESGDMPEPNEKRWVISDTVNTTDDDISDLQQAFLCPYCGALHSAPGAECQNEKCGKTVDLVQVYEFGERVTTCAACGAPNSEDSGPIDTTVSAEVADVTVLAQCMLSAMSEPKLRKLLVFADNRQDAAFQAGWMESRSRRFRLRHLMFNILEEQEDRVWRFDRLCDQLLQQAQQEGIIERKPWQDEEAEQRVRWMVIEEFASRRQRRANLEQLGLARTLYAPLHEQGTPQFFDSWADKLKVDRGDVLAIASLILDYYRKRGAMSDPLLKHWWGYQDPEVREGIVRVYKHYRPCMLAMKKAADHDKKIVKGWIASNGRSAAQVVFKKAVPHAEEQTDAFLVELWEWLEKSGLLVKSNVTQRRHGRTREVSLTGPLYQINHEMVGITETDERFVCDVCRMASHAQLPNGRCPEYNCNGRTVHTGRDEENFDVVRYTKYPLAPLKPREHSAQVSKKVREEIEDDFKTDAEEVNCIVCTPTLELGVDIGELEMALMRNVPPAPANYSQRSGRAGRRQRIAVVFSYCRGSQHDRYFFQDPEQMIAGKIRVPAFSMRNDELIRKHVRSAVLTHLRELVSRDEQETLQATFPSYIRDYFTVREARGDSEEVRYMSHPPEFDDFRDLLHKYEKQLVERLENTFQQTWPDADSECVAADQLREYLEDIPEDLRQKVRQLYSEVQAYRNALKEFRAKEDDGYSLKEPEKKCRRRYENALKSYRRPNLENYTLTYLSKVGFFPGYALSRDSVRAQCLEPFFEVSRPSPIALRELTPGSRVYADRKIYRVRALNFYRLKAQDEDFSPGELRETFYFDRENERIFQEADKEGGHGAPQEFESVALSEIILRQVNPIDDTREQRSTVGYKIEGTVSRHHGGGQKGKIGELDYESLRQAEVKLVNLGPERDNGEFGFPMCPQCGETRSPHVSDTEIDRFAERHRERCKVHDILWPAVHVDVLSDVFRIGPFPERAQAVNAGEGILIGAEFVLDMDENELDGFTEGDDEGSFYYVFYDPFPGGSGYLTELQNHWSEICDAAVEALDSCDQKCEKACYACMKKFWNQHNHKLLDRFCAMEQIRRIHGCLEQEHEIPSASRVSQGPAPEYTTESEAETNFEKILESHSFPQPRRQYRVELENGEYTVADFAYEKEDGTAVLIYVDGTSDTLHGDPKVKRRDKIIRAKAEMLGHKVVQTTADALMDETNVSTVLDQINVYLEQG